MSEKLQKLKKAFGSNKRFITRYTDATSDADSPADFAPLPKTTEQILHEGRFEELSHQEKIDFLKAEDILADKSATVETISERDMHRALSDMMQWEHECEIEERDKVEHELHSGAERNQRIAEGEHFDPIGTSNSILLQIRERQIKVKAEKDAGTYVEPNRDPEAFADLYQPDSWSQTLYIEGPEDPHDKFWLAYYEFKKLMLTNNIRFHDRTRLPSGRVIDQTSQEFKWGDETTKHRDIDLND